MPLANCPSREELAAFSAGNLEDTALTALGTHIDSCPACQRLIQTVSLEASDTIVSALRGSAAANPHAAESACRSAIERIAALPENSAISIPVGTPIAHEAPLQQLREYKLLAKLGEGGMGAVYKALHTRLDKTVAIKVLPADRMRDPGAVARFQREMKAVGRVDHPNIVRAMDAGEENGMHYLVMEYVPGSDLSQLAKAIGPLPVADACELVRQAALGLAEANEHGMVHRDIKPSNLILTQPRKKKDQPVVKILDLGLALLSEAFSPDQRGLTSTGQMMGTIDYMAPEQGGDSHQVDIRADIYSLGATLYKLLTGEAPFASDKYDTPIKKLVALGTVEPDPIRQRRPDVPAPLAAIIHRMLAKDPAARFATPDEVVEALLPFCQGCDLGALLDGRVQGSGFGVQKEEVGGQRSEVGTEKSALAVTAPVISSVSPSLPLPVSPSSSRTRKPPLVALIAAGAGSLALLIAGIVLLIPGKDGTLRIEINDPSIEVAIKGTKIVLKKADNGKDIELAPGERILVVTRGDFSFETDKLVLKKGKTTTVSVDLLPGKVQVAQDGVPLSAVELEPLATPVAALPLYVSPSKYALAFDGKSNYVTLPRVKLDGAQALTIEADIQPTKLQMVDLLGDGAIGFTWCAANCPPHFKFGMIISDKDFPHVNATVGILPREPLHLAGVLDNDEIRVYLNGKVIERRLTPKKRIEPALTAFMIGANEWLALNKPGSSSETESYLNFFEGRIQRLRVSTVARYQENFTPGARFVPDNDTLALYHFDEGQGTELKDSSGNNHHGKIVGAKWVKVDEAGKILASTPLLTAGDQSLPISAANYALEFDGKTSLVHIPSLTWDGTPRLTVEAWLKTRQLKGARHIITVDGEARYQLFQIDGLWAGGMTGEGENQQSQLYFGISPKAKESLVHVAYVVDGTHAAFFQNGIHLGKVKLKSQHYQRKQPARAAIGGVYDKTFLFEGTIDEVRISKIPRYAKNFTPKFGDRFQPDENTLALYHFDEGQGDVLKDSSGNNHHGKIVGAKWVRVDGTQLSPSPTLASDSGRPVLEFNHGPQHVEVDGFPYDPDGPLTLEAWVNLSGLQTAPIIKLRGMPREFVLFRSSPPAANYGFGTHDPTGSQNVLATVPKREGFRHVCGVWDGKTHALYIDGERVGKFETNNLFPTKPDAQDSYLLIGGENGVPISLDGQIAEARISKSVRYADNFAPTAGWQTDKDTLALYRFDEGQGDVLTDSSVNHRHGKIVGAKWGRVEPFAALPPVMASPTPEQVVDLLKLVDVERDAVKGKWTLTANGLASDGTVPFCRLKLPYAPPPEYDFRVEFTAQGGNDILQLLMAGGRDFTWLMGAWGGKYDGFDTVAGHPLTREGTNIIGGSTSVRRGQQHTSVIQVRRDSITATIDGKQVVRHMTDGSDLGIPNEWSIGKGAIGLGTTFDAVVFNKVEIVVPKVESDTQVSLTNVPPPTAKAPFNAAEAKSHQEAWAKHLFTMVETTSTIGQKLRLIPPGEFLMGSTKGDTNEQPVHKVTITRPYYLGTYEVTQDEYEAVVGSNPSKFPGKRLPVEFVTSEEAAEFCKKLSEKEGRTYRLPTEAEWEFACRAGTATEWSFGDDVALLSEYAWCKENGQEKTHPVGEKKPNPFGLFDMHGNVFEYCADYTTAYTADPATDPAGPQLGRYRGFRGGSWFFQKFDSRSADRQDKEWPARGTHVGFRVVLEIKP